MGPIVGLGFGNANPAIKYVVTFGFDLGSAPPAPSGNPPYRFTDTWTPSTGLEGGFGATTLTDTWTPTQSITGGVGE